MEHADIFFQAALPGIALGLLLAVLLVGKPGKKKEKTGDYGMEGLCLGMCLGMVIACSAGYNMGVGLSCGMMFGLAVGSRIEKEEKSDDEE